MGIDDSIQKTFDVTKEVDEPLKLTPSPRQVKAARAAVDMSAQRLADLAGVTKNTVLRYERGMSRPMADTLQALRNVLEQAGIEFVDQGVHWKES